MPEIGEIKHGYDLGKKPPIKKFIWTACVDCGKERWVECVRGQPRTELCLSCSSKRKVREKSGTWKGGRISCHKAGYIQVKLYPDDFFYPMANRAGYVLEHRLVVAKALGRCLQPWEIVHHKGIRHTGIENKSDNLIDNLELTGSLGEHITNHSKGYSDGYQKGLQDGRLKQIQELKARVSELESLLKVTT